MAKLSNKNIARGIYEVLKDKSGKEYTELERKVVEYLARKHLLGRANEILRELGFIADSDAGIARVNLQSAKPLATRVKHEIKEHLLKRYRVREVILNEEIDEKLFGGFRIEAGDEIIDFTLRHQVDQLEEHLQKS
ncbi:MAG: ATP synthase F1 subunit delta [Patescibacteria group bacterium]